MGMVPGPHIHMLSCARMFFNEQRAQDFAEQLGIETAAIMTPASILYVVERRADFRDVWMDKYAGYYFLRGEFKGATGREVLYQSISPMELVEA